MFISFFTPVELFYDLIPDLIEVGVGILNPVQVNAAKMDTKQLKKEFGNSLSFWGGGVDTQRVLPRGTPDEVRDEVKRRIDELAPGGGSSSAPSITFRQMYLLRT
jgi:uroporphyrinogen decarboxylase